MNFRKSSMRSGFFRIHYALVFLSFDVEIENENGTTMQSIKFSFLYKKIFSLFKPSPYKFVEWEPLCTIYYPNVFFFF